MRAGVVWSTLGFGISRGLSFVSLLVLTRLLAPRQFGLVAAVTVVIGVIELTSDLGMSATVIYEQENTVGERVEVAFTLNMMLAVVMAGVGVLLAPLVAGFFHASHHVGLFRLAMLDVFFTGLGVIHNALLLRDLRLNLRTIVQVASAIVRAGVGVALALLGFGAASIVWGLVIGTVCSVTALWLVTGFRPRLRFDRRIAGSMLSFGVAASLFEFLDQAVLQIDTAVVGRVLGQRALGLYSVAFRIPTLVLENIAAQVSLVAFPALARKRAIDSAGVGEATRRLVRYQALYALPLAAGMAVEARPIVETVFSSKWLGATGVFAAVSVMSGISAAGFPLGDALKALGRQRLLVLLTLIQFPLLLATIISVAPYGIAAVAWARTGGMVFWVWLMAVAAARAMNLSTYRTITAMGPGAAVAAAVVAAAGAVRLWSHLPAIPEMLAALVAGGAGALAALALFAPTTFVEFRREALSARTGLRNVVPFRRSPVASLSDRRAG
jgi:PST family polysaccharide transporter